MNFVYCAYGQEHVDMAVRSMQTVLHHCPESECNLYTDQYYDDGPLDQTLAPELFNHPFMLTNVMCQTDWLLRHGESYENPGIGLFGSAAMTTFLDNDIIMRKPMPELPDGADMYVTWRDDVGKLSDAQPYNYGVLIVRHTTAAIRAMMWLEDRVSKLAPKHQKWYGNQIALRELVGPLKRNETVERHFNTFSIKVHQLPCTTWNWSPPMDNLRQAAGDKVFVHLKGNRKDAFDHYYDKAMNE